MNNTYHILVVDDEEDLCEILQFNLEKEGYYVDVAYSSEEALKKDFRQYDLFLLDVMMGEISGFKLGSDIKRNEATSHIPIIFLTAKVIGRYIDSNSTIDGFCMIVILGINIS